MVKPGFALLLLAYLAFVSIGLPDTVLGVAWPSLQREFAVEPSALGAVLSSAMAGYFLAGLLAGTAVTRLGVGGVLTVSSALVVAALIGYALAPSWAVFVPFGIVWGLGSGAIDAGLNGYAARHFSVRHVNWLHACWGLGASIGPAMMTFFIARGDGFRAGYLCLAAVLGGMALLFLFTRRRWGQTEPDPSAGSAALVRKSGNLCTALCSGRVWLQVLAFLLYTGVESTVGQWCFSWLRGERGLSVESAGSWTSAYWVSLTAGRVVVGALMGRVGPDSTLRIATVLAVTGAMLFAVADGTPGRLGLLLLGWSLAPMFPTLMARTPARVGETLAHHAVGLQVSAATLGSAVVPSLAGLLVARHGLSVVGPLVVAVALALLLTHEALLATTRRAYSLDGAA